MKNDERDENSPVEIIEGRLKRLHTNEIDGRNRLRLREEEKGVGWRENTTKILRYPGRMKSRDDEPTMK